ncbi:hypothetical protein KQI76_08470 [Amphibacillus sp. MSJ-3]|uniref:hypothetical protein n=1 Tax=Amphibacillus sp. MSJ-3 TaxID=2841505 RepID=UPI001C0F0474|nr:hypothetical protein [Amphibacillus sp. MSJ-3]MBU5595198.1 hypothetical protein [Amphibacillus sp. MSJ-3]
MGYILPIQNYQSQNDHERVIQAKTDPDPIPVDRLYPKRIELSYATTTHQEGLLDENLDEKGSLDHLDKAYNMVISDQMKDVYAKLTGIGGQINAYV